MTVTARKNNSPKAAHPLANVLSTILIQRGKSLGQPLIVENQIAQTKSIHVVVIWDLWVNLSPAERSKIILEAYAKAKRLADKTITVAMGLTSEEAIRMGFLPYSIVVTHRPVDNVSLNKLMRGMAGVGGVLLKIGTSTQLRFPTMEQAEDAYRQLSRNEPGPYWAIVHEQSTSD